MKSMAVTKSRPSSVLTNDPTYTPIDISNLISDKYVSKILMVTHKRAQSVQTISNRYDIPIAVCYRRMRQLERLGFVRCVESLLNGNGKRVKMYQSQIINAHFYLEKGVFRARVQLASGVIDDFGGNWSLTNEAAH